MAQRVQTREQLNNLDWPAGWRAFRAAAAADGSYVAGALPAEPPPPTVAGVASALTAATSAAMARCRAEAAAAGDAVCVGPQVAPRLIVEAEQDWWLEFSSSRDTTVRLGRSLFSSLPERPAWAREVLPAPAEGGIGRENNPPGNYRVEAAFAALADAPRSAAYRAGYADGGAVAGGGSRISTRQVGSAGRQH